MEHAISYRNLAQTQAYLLGLNQNLEPINSDICVTPCQQSTFSLAHRYLLSQTNGLNQVIGLSASLRLTF